MANINSLMGTSNTQSIYGNRNIISGLASGLDTESMIANSVKSYKVRITSLQQKQTVLQWKQDAFRSITDKMIELTRKYTSYTSSTNLLSPSFFNRASITTPQGANASAVSATGKTNSDVQITSIKDLATSASYTVSSGIGGNTGKILASGEIDLAASMPMSNIAGTMTLNYGGKTVDLDFGEIGEDVFETVEDLKKAIESKLKDAKISNNEGKMIAASELISVKLDGDEISFSDKSGAKNTVSLRSVSEGMQKAFGGDDLKLNDKTNPATSFKVTKSLLQNENSKYGDYLAGKEMTFTLDGVTKKIKLPEYGKDPATTASAYANALNTSLSTAFGSGKISVTNEGGTNLKLSFDVSASPGSTLSISSSIGEVLGFTGGSATSYLNTSKKLGELNVFGGLDPTSTDKDGNKFYEFKLNGVSIGNFTKDTSLESVLLAINSNTEAGVSASYSKMTGQFTFTSKETGAASRIEFGEGLAQKMFGAGDGPDNLNEVTITQGSDAEFTVKVNNQTMNLKRASNVVDLDGLSVTLKERFEGGEPITFTSKSDADKIVDTVKSFADDINALLKEIHEGYTTQPARKSNKSVYLPLTDEDKATMSESAVKAYEDKAKQGLLFADSDLSALYNRLRTALNSSGSDGAALRSIGLTTEYAKGEITFALDESKLRSALEKNPDMVKDIFTKTIEGGASSNGLVQSIKNTMDAYASTSIAEPGILVRKAGTKLSSLSLLKNTLQTNIDNLNTQIGRWQTKMSGRVDYYTKKFTALERLMSQMNAQSASLYDMMGGY